MAVKVCKEGFLHSVILPPEIGAVGSALFLITTSSKELQVPLVSVHRSVIFTSAGTKVTAVVAEVGEVITAEPDSPTKVQDPLPPGGTPALLKLLVLHFVWSGPAA